MIGKFTLASLFDGSGGFPLAGRLCGIDPVWASEVEPYPIAVTKSRFPDMLHLGSVTDINGGKVSPVYVVTFGSPCQGLSNAGLRKGLADQRSGLFLEAVRIIKEMREATNGIYPAFVVWENVPGAFSSNKGEDFKTVCEELIKIVEPGASMPAVPQSGWPYADCYRGDGWSLAYRVFDAQYWGVPQRRRRIYLVLDLRGQCAGKILFKRESLRGYFEEGRTPWEETSRNAENCVGADDRKIEALMDAYQHHGWRESEKVGSLTTKSCSMVRGDTPLVVESTVEHNATYWDGSQICGTLTANNAGGNQRMPDKDNFNCVIAAASSRYIVRRLTPTECARLQGFPDKWGHPDKKDDLTEDEYRFWLDVRNTHEEINGKPVKDHTKVQILKWYNGLHTDSNEYKMWGNGIALPCALYVMQGIAECLEGDENEPHRA